METPLQTGMLITHGSLFPQLPFRGLSSKDGQIVNIYHSVPSYLLLKLSSAVSGAERWGSHLPLSSSHGNWSYILGMVILRILWPRSPLPWLMGQKFYAERCKLMHPSFIQNAQWSLRKKNVLLVLSTESWFRIWGRGEEQIVEPRTSNRPPKDPVWFTTDVRKFQSKRLTKQWKLW